jgi:hypothetical protein
MIRFSIQTTIFCLFIGLCACKKNHTCNCFYDYKGADTLWTSTKDVIIEETTKDEASELCNQMDKSSTLLSETLTIDCELK